MVSAGVVALTPFRISLRTQMVRTLNPVSTKPGEVQIRHVLGTRNVRL